MRRNRTTMPPKKKLKTTCEQYLEEIERIRERTMHSRTKRPLSGRDVTELQKALFYGCCTKNVKILTDIVDFAIEKNHFNIMWFKGLKEEQIYEICGQKFALSEKDYVLDLCILNHWPNDKLFAVLEAYEKLDAEGRMFFTKTGKFHIINFVKTTIFSVVIKTNILARIQLHNENMVEHL